MFEPEECPFRPDLEAFWDGELEVAAWDAVRLHLGACAGCAAEHRLQEGVSLLLQGDDPAEALPAQAAQRIRADLLRRAAASLVEDAVQPVPVRGNPWGRARSLCIWSPALAAVWLIARWLPGWLSPAPQVVVRIASPPPAPKQLAVAPSPLQAPHVDPTQSSRPLRGTGTAVAGRSDAPRQQPAATIPARVAAASRPSLLKPVSARAESRLAAPERLVIDMSGSRETAPAPAPSVTLIASGSPDLPGGEAIIIRTDATEETP